MKDIHTHTHRLKRTLRKPLLASGDINASEPEQTFLWSGGDDFCMCAPYAFASDLLIFEVEPLPEPHYQILSHHVQKPGSFSLI